MGKYTQFRSSLPKKPLDQDKPGFAAKVEEKRKEFAALGLAELTKLMCTAKIEKDDLEDGVSAVNVEIMALDLLLQDAFGEAGIEKITSPSKVTLYINDDPYCSIEDRQKLMEWIESTGSQYLLGVQWQTLNSMVKGNLIKGVPQPPGVKMYMNTRVRVRGNKAKEDEG